MAYVFYIFFSCKHPQGVYVYKKRLKKTLFRLCARASFAHFLTFDVYKIPNVFLDICVFNE